MTAEYPETIPHSKELISLQGIWLMRQWDTLSSEGNWATLLECDNICALREGSLVFAFTKLASLLAWFVLMSCLL